MQANFQSLANGLLLGAVVSALGACGIAPSNMARSGVLIPGATPLPAGNGDQTPNGQPTPAAGDQFVYGLTSEEAFKVSVYPVAVANCSHCHRADGPSGAVQPYFASTNAADAFKAVIDSKKVDLTVLDSSRLYRRLKVDSHQCWSGDCAADAAVMLKALGEWAEHMKTKEQANPGASLLQTGDLLASQTEQRPATADPQTILLEAEAGTLTAPMVSTADATASGGRFIQVANNGQNLTLAANAVGAGVVVYRFNTTIAGTYQVFGLTAALTNADQSFYVGIDATPLVPWILPITTSFTWGAANNNTAALSFPLTVGAHTLTIRQRQDGSRLDRVAVSMAPVYFGPPKGGVVRVLRYDLSAMAKKPGVFFEIELEDFDQGSLKLRNPRILSASQPVHVKGVHLILNGQDDQRYATYYAVDQQVAPPMAMLSTASMIVLPDLGPTLDKLAFRFDGIE